MIKQSNRLSLVGLLLLLFNIFCSVRANNIIVLKPPHQESASASPFSILTATTTDHQVNGTSESYSYTVTITTSCSSPKYTRDQISLSMGDSFGNEVYAPRIEDPSSGTFEQCAVDTFDITGPCLFEVCYLYLYRSGSDGWMPESVQVENYYTGTSTFFFDEYIPADIWYGYNYCENPSPSGSSPSLAAHYNSLAILIFVAFLVLNFFQH